MFSLPAILELRRIVKELKNYLSNNYKDAAHEQRKLLGEKSEQYYADKKISRKQFLHYRKLYAKYTEQMKDYHH